MQLALHFGERGSIAAFRQIIQAVIQRVFRRLLRTVAACEQVAAQSLQRREQLNRALFAAFVVVFLPEVVNQAALQRGGQRRVSPALPATIAGSRVSG